MAIFKNFWSFPEFVPVCKKSVSFICSFLRYSRFSSPVIRLTTPIFDHVHSKNFSSTFNFCEYVSTCKKISLFYLILSILEKKEGKNQLIPSANSWDTVNFRARDHSWPYPTITKHFGLYLRNQIFSKYKIWAATQQITQIFITEQIHWRLMTTFSLNSKTLFLTYFLPTQKSLPQLLDFLNLHQYAKNHFILYIHY